ncbi:hypothetical protein EV189_2317 [Motilibacter rhizosphaerae]|uniref:Uncharacterized protein n=1 Tax=Motilibacter rhizosphaerae TaxID=598652 RepID=A0A4Q7NNT1_9ACTN|nr:hypothetical protein [Motilibacter rhizosphaerae]RZS86899.1 hypothetical protein EV189_2317 [Motilibacter rhizosphaerae]
MDPLARHPVLWHVAFTESWPSIQEHGLLSAAAIVKRWQVPADQADQLLAQRRPEIVRLEHPVHGVAVLRDQAPIQESRLQSDLRDGMTVEDWFRLLNSFVFLYPTEEGARQLAEKYSEQADVTLLRLRTSSLLNEYRSTLRLTSINTGATRFSVPRGRATFSSVNGFRKDRVAEVAVQEQVYDLDAHLLSVEHLPQQVAAE